MIVTGSNYLGGSNGEGTQRIGTSGTDCGGSRSVFGQLAVHEAGDVASICGDHWLPSKVGDLLNRKTLPLHDKLLRLHRGSLPEKLTLAMVRITHSGSLAFAVPAET